MTAVCFRGKPDLNVRNALLGYETARSALSPYEITEPFENTIAVDTVSLGAAISLLNDLSWYLARTTEGVMLKDPSVSPTEWLSRELATAVRSGTIEPADTGTYLKVYGVKEGALIEPMFVTRRDGAVPKYDLADVSDTVVLRVTESEFENG